MEKQAPPQVSSLSEMVSLAKEFNKFIMDSHKKYGAVFSAFLPAKRVYFVTGVENCENFYDEKNVERIFWPKVMSLAGTKNSVIFQNGEQHRKQKQFLLDAMEDSKLEPILALAQREIAEMARRWRNLPGEFVSEPYIHELVSRIIFISLIGETDSNWFAVLDAIRAAEEHPPINLSILGRPITHFSRGLQSRDKLYNFILDRVKRSGPLLDRMPPSILKNLIQNKTKDTTAEMIAQEILFLFAGAAVTTRPFLWALYLILKDKRVNQNIVNELNTKMIGRESLSIRELDSLKFCEMVVREVCRKGYPVGPTFFGKTKREFKVVDGAKTYFVPKDQVVIFSLHNTSASEEVFPERTEEFWPERFECPFKGNTKENSNVNSADKPFPNADEFPFADSDIRKLYGYVPFGGGERQNTHRCAGERIATLWIKSFIVILWSNLELMYPPQDETFDWSTFAHFRFKSGVRLRVKPRSF